MKFAEFADKMAAALPDNSLLVFCSETESTIVHTCRGSVIDAACLIAMTSHQLKTQIRQTILEMQGEDAARRFDNAFDVAMANVAQVKVERKQTYRREGKA
jgi:hypothetical protein